MMNFRLFALVAVLAVTTVGDAFAKKHCWCHWKVGSKDGAIVKGYDALAEYPDYAMGKEKECSIKCSDKASPDRNSQAMATTACQMGVGNGAMIRAYSKVGANGNNDPDVSSSPLINTPAKYSCAAGALNGANCVITVAAKANCPKDYWLESHKQPFKCVKQACAAGSMSGVPAWQAIGGAVNGGQYLTDDKGGSRFFINATFSCESGFNLAGTNCVKTVPATLVAPAQCKF